MPYDGLGFQELKRGNFLHELSLDVKAGPSTALLKSVLRLFQDLR